MLWFCTQSVFPVVYAMYGRFLREVKSRCVSARFSHFSTCINMLVLVHVYHRNFHGVKLEHFPQYPSQHAWCYLQFIVRGKESWIQRALAN